MEKSDKSKSSHESIDQLAMDIIHIKYQSIWNRLQVNNTKKWTYWEFNYVSKTPQTLVPLQKRGLVPAVLATASDTSGVDIGGCGVSGGRQRCLLLILSVLVWWCWCGRHPSRRAIPRQTPIGPATTCIRDDDRRHASHTDACPVGLTLGEGV